MAGLLLGGRDFFAQDKYSVRVPNGLAFSEFRAGSLSHPSERKPYCCDPRESCDDKGLLDSGFPRQRQAFPRRLQDGEDPLNPTKMEFNHRATWYPAPALQRQLHGEGQQEVRGQRRGWGAFEYNAASNTFTPATSADKPPQGNDAKCGLACHTIVNYYVSTAYAKRGEGGAGL